MGLKQLVIDYLDAQYEASQATERTAYNAMTAAVRRVHPSNRRARTQILRKLRDMGGSLSWVSHTNVMANRFEWKHSDLDALLDRECGALVEVHRGHNPERGIVCITMTGLAMLADAEASDVNG